jgi:alpha-beta hydrolase superfamily lysophospholipase
MQYDILRRSIVAKAFPILLLAIAAGFFVPDRVMARQWPWPDSAEVTVMSPDSLELVGNLYLPKGAKQTKLPLVILLHQTAETHGVWKDLADVLCRNGYAVFAMDLRGCGYSIYDFRTGKNRPPNTFYIGEQARYPADLRQLVGKLFTEHGKILDSTRMAVIGAELGGNVGLLYAVDEPGVRFTALISPGLDYSGLQIGKAIKDYGERPLFMATAKKDIYSMESLDLLSDIVPRVLDAAVFDTYRYGNALIATEPQLVRMLTDRLQKYLKQPN